MLFNQPFSPEDRLFSIRQAENNLPKYDRWYAVQVVARQEHKVAAMLEYKGYEYFLPLAKPALRQPVKKVPGALFPGYVFCRLHADTNGLIVTTPGVIRILGHGGSPVAVPEEEMRNLQLIANADVPTETSDILRIGEPVQIEAGPLRGLRGLLMAIKNCRKVAVSVELLCRSVTVELNGWDVRVIDQPKPPRMEVAAAPVRLRCG